MLMAFIVTLVCIAALLRGGSLRNFANLPLRWIPLAIGSFVLQLMIFTPFRKTPLIAVWTTQIYVLSMALLVVWVALNWRIPGMAFMAAGLLANFAAIVANGGYMPVSPESAGYAGRIASYASEGLPVANNSLVTDSQVRLWPLTDILALPSWVPFANVYSIGDILLTIGAAVLCYRTIRRSPPAAPTLAASEAIALPRLARATIPPRAASELAQRLKAELHLVESLLDQDTDTIARMAVQVASLRGKLKSSSELEEPVLSNQGDDLAVGD
jgi:hypothetical protein